MVHRAGEVAFPRRKAQRHIGRRRPLTVSFARPLRKATHRVTAALVTPPAQLLENADQRQLLARKLSRIAAQQFLKLSRPSTQLRARLDVPLKLALLAGADVRSAKIESAAEALSASSAVLASCAAGVVSPRDAAEIMGLVSTHVHMLELTDIEARLTALEKGQPLPIHRCAALEPSRIFSIPAVVFMGLDKRR